MTDAMPLLPGLPPVAGKSLTAKFDAGRLSSDGGVIVLREAAMRLGLAEAITAPLVDHRDPSRVQYSYAEIPMIPCMASRNSLSSTRIMTAPASSRSTSSRRCRESRSYRSSPRQAAFGQGDGSRTASGRKWHYSDPFGIALDRVNRSVVRVFRTSERNSPWGRRSLKLFFPRSTRGKEVNRDRGDMFVR
jgi:hypothetical protein